MFGVVAAVQQFDFIRSRAQGSTKVKRMDTTFDNPRGSGDQLAPPRRVRPLSKRAMLGVAHGNPSAAGETIFGPGFRTLGSTSSRVVQLLFRPLHRACVTCI